MEETMVDENRAEDTARNIGGKIQDAVGDAATQAREQMNRAAGSAQDAYGQAIGELRSFAADQPIATLCSAMALGVVIGFLLARR
jgi:ElaB/YqjD/DUF883 family membrane-anchored ribosome-binding protein